jgi:hypothetical protein
MLVTLHYMALTPRLVEIFVLEICNFSFLYNIPQGMSTMSGGHLYIRFTANNRELKLQIVDQHIHLCNYQQPCILIVVNDYLVQFINNKYQTLVESSRSFSFPFYLSEEKSSSSGKDILYDVNCM